jgi:hypothetical protein
MGAAHSPGERCNGKESIFDSSKSTKNCTTGGMKPDFIFSGTEFALLAQSIR